MAIGETEIGELSGVALLRLMRQRKLSPIELMDYTIDRIEKRNPSLNALIFTDFDQARRRARDAEQAIMSLEKIPALTGLPVAMKDISESKKGWKTTFGGVRSFKDYVAQSDTLFPERMEAAGAIIVGKTNAPSFGFRGVTDNYLFGPTRNPFNLSKNAGGSSGGSAAAVADGLVSIAEGTDGGGSIRIPAAWCGVYGYKPSFGRVPSIFRPNAYMGAAPFLFEGAITRFVEDAALAVSTLAGFDSRDPFSIDASINPVGAIQGSLKGWKIAFTPDFGIYPVEAEVLRVVYQALEAFQAAGAHVEEVHFGIKRSANELSDTWLRIQTQNVLAGISEFSREGLDLLKDRAGDLPPEIHHWCGVASGMSAQDYIADQIIRSEVYDAISSVLDGYRLIVSPTLACLPVDNAENGATLGPSEINGVSIDPVIGWCLTYLTNFTGHPAASVPAGLSATNLPVGLQIIGRRLCDEDVLLASAELERLRPWRKSYRVCAERPLTA